jgi:pimeloyl-ACP methyl ester carboxylesterase
LRLRWKITLGALLDLAALLALNTIVVDAETEGAEATVEDGEILELPGGDLQVLEEGPTEAPPARAGPPIVLVHCYSCSLHWWDRMAPILAERHRVVRIDLLGHGGSEKPSTGYTIPDQGALVAGALNRLGIEAATVVGHSMGFAVTVALAEQASQLVDRMVNLGAGPTVESCSIPFIARLAYAPILGQALWRITPDFAIEDGYESLFAPDYDVEAGFPNPDQIVDDYRAMTFTSFAEARAGNNDYREQQPLDERVRATAVPLMSVFGADDEICEPGTSQAAYETVPGARTVTIEGAGHSPNVERPQQTARLIEGFANEMDVDPPRSPR